MIYKLVLNIIGLKEIKMKSFKIFLNIFFIFCFFILLKPSKLKLENYSKYNLLGNIYYFIADTYKKQKNYVDAADYYLKAYKSFTDTEKSSKSLLNLGIMLVNFGEKTEGCNLIGGVPYLDPKPKIETIKLSYQNAYKLKCSLDYNIDNNEKVLT